MDFFKSRKGKLIISADDFGISPRANRNILYLIDLGKVDRVGVMVNGEISPTEVAELMRSGVKLDIHLDILHQIGKQRKTRRGSFFRILEFIKKYICGEISSARVETDWEKQIQKFKEIFGKNPDGLNSHEHVHFFPKYFKIALKLRNKHLIPYVRLGDSARFVHNNPVAITLNFLRKINRIYCKENECVSSGSLISLDWIKNLDIFLDNLHEGTIEIVCHPEIAEDFVRVKKYF